MQFDEMVHTTPEQFEKHLSAPEGTQLEFKAARSSYEFDKLVTYCVALANERGGTMILGVTDKRPREVVGTTAFPEPGETEASLHRALGHRIPIEEYHHDGNRVLIIHIPSRLPGTAWQLDGKYLKRAGDALVPMGDQELRAIFAETGPDFTAEIVPGASFRELQPEAVSEFRKRWQRKSGNTRLSTMSDEQILHDCSLMEGDGITYAALILLGRPSSITRHLAQAEVIFEYRSVEAAGPAADREEYREPFLLFHDRLWTKINLRNDRQSYQDDFFRYDIPTFDETAIREGILNAICHRDYRLGGSVFIRQYSRRLEIVSPGGFPPGITLENIADQQNPRNRRLAEALSRCGFIERSGQGVNLMIERAIRQTKPLPDFSRSATHEVFLALAGAIQNPAFLRFIERLGEDALSRFQTLDFLALDTLAHGRHLTSEMKTRLPDLIGAGAVESQGRGKGKRFFLSRELYAEMGSPGSYTRLKGLDHETNKALLLKHLQDAGAAGAPIREFEGVLPAQSRTNIRRMLSELRDEGLVDLQGNSRAQRWFMRQNIDSGS
ncbi:MAG: putative DNA binding domain-containing protein [Akkermansiaceae bacterium]|nr:putative DNA binding domain-containing protein [Akkermansiaceae bacterium]